MLKGERVPLIACLTSTCVQGQEQEFYLIFFKHKSCYLDYFTSLLICALCLINLVGFISLCSTTKFKSLFELNLPPQFKPRDLSNNLQT